ncbi:hypothetical protein Agub_g1654 [Astrephomene gubernaculifera]|uniref:16S rRNA (uracil(1498)-N(3))-methyltransferase n=1 Tax=Astrephomene gubernaculifera TaxID=47775 RepID=A0AAD3DGT4_9CHLO|nr:hypothetical protein Agub_g1654 [Astrephomene gubernaculifera]
MASALPRATRCMPQLAVLSQPAYSGPVLLVMPPRRRVASSSILASTSTTSTSTSVPAQPLKRSKTTNGTPVAATGVWGEQEFGALQHRAATRLHRFYVPHPLGPAPPPPTLQTLLSPPPPVPLPAPAPTTTSSSPVPTTSAPATVVLEGEEARHAARALRLAAGDRLELCDGRGNLVEGTVTGTDKQRVWVSPDGPVVHTPWRGPRWVLAVACTTLKGGRAEWLVEKAAELGAAALLPLVTERSQIPRL